MKLSEESVEFAKKHITKYYDSDFFPKSDTFSYLWQVWDDVKNYLLNSDIRDFVVTSPKMFAAPKPNKCFRIVHQLEPLNAIIYTALAFMVANKIESCRIPATEHIACSYRIKTNSEGEFFKKQNFYDDFQKKEKELAMKYKFVLKTDVTDFYNQIYIHRLQNAIETADSSLFEVSKDIEKFLLNLNNNASKGIPVGPAASIIFSEAIMIDVDNFILNHGFEFTRYADDIRVFSNNEMELKLLLQDLTVYLYENHRLHLSAQKTEMKDSFSFLVEDLERPEEKERQKQHEHLTNLTRELFDGNTYADSYVSSEWAFENLSDSARWTVVSDSLSSLLYEIVQSGKLDVSLTKHILKRAKGLRIRSILPLVIENFDFFIPVIREVCLYLNNVLNAECIFSEKDTWKSILYNSESVNLNYTKYWIDWLVAENISYFSDIIFKRYI